MTKMKCDIDDVEVPEGVLKLFEEWLESEEGEDYTDKDQEDALWDFYSDKLNECNGKLVDKELAEFLMLVNQNNIPFEGGYPKYSDADFEIEGRKFTAISFFWDTLDKNDEPYVMVYEKIHACASGAD